jgi:hypothetical protein
MVAESIANAYKPGFLKNLELTDRIFRNILRDKNVQGFEAQMDREFVIILLLILKNELRCPKGGVVSRVRSIFTRPDIRSRVLNTPVTITQKSNRLLYACMRHPSALMILACKTILTVYDKKTN